MDVGAELDALGNHLLQPPVEHPFFHLELGDAVAQQSADTVSLLEHRYRMPGASGGAGRIQPSRKPCSMICFSMTLIATGGSLMPSTQAASQGAGQIRPVNSGKLLVACSARIASRQWSRYTRSFQSGMTLFSGQPL